MTPEERALQIADRIRPVLEENGIALTDSIARAIARAIHAAVEEEREAYTELLAAAEDAVETFEQGGMSGGPILRLRSAAAGLRARARAAARGNTAAAAVPPPAQDSA